MWKALKATENLLEKIDKSASKIGKAQNNRPPNVSNQIVEKPVVEANTQKNLKREKEVEALRKRVEKLIKERISNNNKNVKKFELKDKEIEELKESVAEMQEKLKISEELFQKMKKDRDQIKNLHEETQRENEKEIMALSSKIQSYEASNSELSQEIESSKVSYSSQIGILNEELRRLVIEKNQYKLSQNNTSSQNSDFFEIMKQQKEEQVNQLQKQLESKIEDINEVKRENEKNVNELQSVRNSHDKLEEKLKVIEENRPSSEEFSRVQKRLGTLENLHFSSMKKLNVDVSKQSIEELLNKKNQMQQDEIISLKNRLAETTKEFQSHVLANKEMQRKLEQGEELVNRLENDLEKRYGVGELMNSEDGESSSSLSHSQRNLDDGMFVKVVAQQRDRYKERLQKMEEMEHAVKQEKQSLQSKISQLQHENVRLFEKIRYMESYGGGTRSRRFSNDDTVIDMESLSISGYNKDSVISEKYQRLYEDRLSKNPFDQFVEKEKERGMHRMNKIEKFTLNMFSSVLKRKYGRVLIFFVSFYVILLHFLIIMSFF